MSKLDELIEKLCPNGVEYKTLGEIGKFYGGLTGKSKKDFNNGNAKFITYKNVYDNLSLKIDIEDKVFVGENENQRTLEYGDIIFTASSETPDECGISSVLTQKTNEKLYLNSFCFFLRLNDKNLLNPNFAKHLFRSSNLRSQIEKTASGVTRFNVSKKAMEKVCIPVPPLEVQCEIVHILDDFTEFSTKLSTELLTELKARKKQYEYYTRNLLQMESEPILKLKEISVNIFSGKNKERLSNGKYNVYGSTGVISTTNNAVYEKEQILIARVGANAGYVHIACGKYDVSDNTLIIDLKDNINLKYVYYQLSNMNLHKYAKGGGQPLVTASQIKELEIVLPSMEKQKEIVNILDKFYKICSDISEGLLAEIEARRKQYEYYRDKLLTFKELKVNE